MKTLKWFSLEWDEQCKPPLTIFVKNLLGEKIITFACKTTQEAFTWLENNGYIERI